jgi:hypothetical protein
VNVAGNHGDPSVPMPGRPAAAIRRARIRARYSARALASRYPWPFLPIVRHRHPGQIVDADTELVIEGFPRSGNTFAVVAFELAQGRPVKIAHHLHAAAQVTCGVRLGKPMLVLIRDPVEAVSSHLVREPGVTPRQGISNWIRFYRSVEPMASKILVARFEDVTTDFGSVIDRLNERFNASFVRFEHSRRNVERCFELIEQRNRFLYSRLEETKIARPSSARDVANESLRQRLDAPRMRPLLRTAYRLRDALVEREMHRPMRRSSS